MSPSRAPRLAAELLEDRLAPAAAPGLKFLANMHDEFHTRLPVSDDVSSAGNHFLALGYLPDQNAPVAVNGSWTDNPHSGATAIRNELKVVPGQPYGGVYFQNGLLGPDGTTATNFGDTANAGFPIPAPARLTFWARGETGAERVEFFAFGVGRDVHSGTPTSPFPDSSPRVPVLGTLFTLTAGWQQFTIDLTGTDTSYVLGGFAWTATVANNPAGAVFFLDDVQYELTAAGAASRGNEPRFVRSFRTGPFQATQPGPLGDFDFVLRNSAFAYDNAVAALAFLADTNPATQADSLRRARLIGDAFAYATTHDRHYTDGRVRTDYAAGDAALFPGWVANGKTGTAPVAGFFDETQQRFFEVEQLNVDTGNNSWAMVALLGLYSRTGGPAYLAAARRVGEFIQTLRNDAGTYHGFLGGINNADHLTLPPTQRRYASTEHNIDVYAAFTRMYQITGESVWRDGADHAWQFVEAMFEPARGCYLAGTKDPDTLNADPGQLPLDVQVWAVLARPEVLAIHPGLLARVDEHFRTTEGGVTGYDFNDDKDGVWSEGTAQAAVAFAVAGNRSRVLDLRAQLDRIRETATAPGADGLGIPAALHDGLTTGFLTGEGRPFLYFNRLHTGATAWTVFAQAGFNPYYQSAIPLPARQLVLVGGTTDGAVRVLSAAGGAFTLDDPFAGLPNAGVTARTAAADVTGDGVPDFIVGAGPGSVSWVVVLNGADKSTLVTFSAFEEAFRGGVFVTAADIDGDGRAEVVVTADESGGPVVAVYRGSQLAAGVGGPAAQVTRFFGIAGDPNFRGGCRPALGDLNGDGAADLVISAGVQGGPRIAIFDGQSLKAGSGDPGRLVGDFFAFEDTLRNGTFVAAGDVTGDGRADVAFGGGPGGAPRVRLFDGKALLAAPAFGNVDAVAGAAQRANFFAGDVNSRGGVRPALRDLDGDGASDLAAGSGAGGVSRVRVYRAATLLAGANSDQELDPFGAALAAGVFVG